MLPGRAASRLPSTSPAASSTTSATAAGTTSAARPATAPSDTATDAREGWLGLDRNGAVRDARSSSRSIHGAAA